MDVTQIISIIGGIVAALIFIYLLTKSDGKKQAQRTPSIVKGLSYFFANNDKEALDEMRALAFADKGTPEIYLAIGFLYRKSGEFTKAAQVHEILLGSKDLDNDYKSYLTSELAKDYLLADMPLKAITILQNTPSAENNADNLETLAKANFKMQDYDKAIAYIEKYEKKSGKTILNFYAKCMVAKAISADDASKGLKYIKSALQKSPDCRSAHFIKAGLLIKEDKKSKAINEYTQILTKGFPRDEKDMQDLESAFIAIGEEGRFIKLIKELVLKSQNPFIHISLANRYMSEGDKIKAKDILIYYLEHVGGSPAAIKYLATINGEKILLNALGNRKTFRCSICRTDFDEYKDDCPVCSTFDEIYAK